MSSGSTPRGSSSGSSRGGPSLDAETEALLDTLPMNACVGRALDKLLPKIPPEVDTALRARGAAIASSRHLKTSFHKTFLVELSSALQHEGQSYSRAIVQVIGVELGDKPVFGDLRVSNLVRAHELAHLAGVRVPAVFATGPCETEMGRLEFIIEEFVETQTVEDHVVAPRAEWNRIRQEVVDKLKSRSLVDVDTSPLPRYDTCQVYIDHLLSLIPAPDRELATAMAQLREQAAACAEVPTAVLLHQDINGGNLLCSQCPGGGAWKLDALIDWESAAVVHSKIYDKSDAETWATVETFATVVKGAHLADRFVKGTLPRCEIGELIENYSEAAHQLDRKGLLPFQTWAARVAQCRAAFAEHSAAVTA